MLIQGAVLEAMGSEFPYSQSKPITISEIELSEPLETEILVKIEAAGICHSDLAVVQGVRPRPTPMLLGHEAAGIVEKVGSQVSNLKIGDRVVMTFSPRCGNCKGCNSNGKFSCINGTISNGAGDLLSGGSRLSRDNSPLFHHLGVSAFATHAVVDHRSVVAVQSDIPSSVAALLGCAVLTGGGALINAVRIESGQSIAIVGLGGVGMAGLITALALGHGDVYGVDLNASRRATALELGATAVFDVHNAIAEKLQADVVLEAAGVAKAFEASVNILAPGGTLVTVGLPAPADLATISPLTLVAQGKTIVGSYLGSSVASRDVPIFADLWRNGKLPIESLVSSSITLDEINTGMDRLARGQELRQMINF
jgi:alcohol dehydrogenase